MNLDLEQTKFNGEGFVPAAIAACMGDFPRIRAAVKREPEHFVVEEQSTGNHRCTIDPVFQDTSESGNGGPYIAVTLVKRRLTTPLAIEKLKRMLPRQADVRYAGLKDRWAVTSQRVTIAGVEYDDVVRCCMPSQYVLNSEGFFIKDPVTINKMLDIGHLVGNNFNIKVSAPGFKANQLRAYMDLRMQEFIRRGSRFPNAFGRQRLGRRQNLFGVGYDFIHSGPEAAIRRFLTETSPAENSFATETRIALLREWKEAEKLKTGKPICQQTLRLQAMKSILECRHYGKPAYENLNMVIEHRILGSLLRTGEYAATMRRLSKDFGLWIGAYQGYYFNKVLAAIISGELNINLDNGDGKIPLIMADESAGGESTGFYRKYCPEAMPRRDEVHEDAESVWQQFFIRRQGHGRGPRRPALVPVKDLQYTCENGAVQLSFQLRSGAYATTFLGTLFDLEGDQDQLVLSES